MNVNDIPKEIHEQLRIQFESNPDVKQLRTSQQYFQKTGKWQEALEVAKTLDALFSIVLHGYIQKAENEAVAFNSETSNLPTDAKEEMMVYLLVVFMACELIDSAVIAFDDILRREKPGVSITTFNDIRQIAGLAREKLRYFEKYGDFMDDHFWGYKCDDMFDMIFNKARSIYRKRKENDRWGENMKNLINKHK